MPEWEELHKSMTVEEPHERFVVFAEKYLRPGMRILDHGCGKGRHSLYCARKGMEVHGVDASETAIKSLRERVEKGQLFELVKVTKSDICELPYPDAYFDGLVSVNVVNHGYLVDVKKFFLEMSRVLKPGGFLFILCAPIEFIDDIRLPETREVEKGTFLDTNLMDGDILHHLFTKDEMKELLKDYDVIKLENFRKISEFMKRDVTRMEVIGRKR